MGDASSWKDRQQATLKSILGDIRVNTVLDQSVIIVLDGFNDMRERN